MVLDDKKYIKHLEHQLRHQICLIDAIQDCMHEYEETNYWKWFQKVHRILLNRKKVEFRTEEK